MVKAMAVKVRVLGSLLASMFVTLPVSNGRAMAAAMILEGLRFFGGELRGEAREVVALLLGPMIDAAPTLTGREVEAVQLFFRVGARDRADHDDVMGAMVRHFSREPLAPDDYAAALGAELGRVKVAPPDGFDSALDAASAVGLVSDAAALALRMAEELERTNTARDAFAKIYGCSPAEYIARCSSRGRAS